jgi:hypothetical protein
LSWFPHDRLLKFGRCATRWWPRSGCSQAPSVLRRDIHAVFGAPWLWTPAEIIAGMKQLRGRLVGAPLGR